MTNAMGDLKAKDFFIHLPFCAEFRRQRTDPGAADLKASRKGGRIGIPPGRET
jgi:hypothetical protein